MFEDFIVVMLIGRIFKFCPKIAKVGGKLVARSSILAQVLTLFAAARRVTVDPTIRGLTIRRRLFWFFNATQRIDFDRILNVTYDYSEVAPTSQVAWAYYSCDLFTVGLQLKTGEQILLFRFFGGGDFVNDSFLPDWMYWQDELEAKLAHGSQEREAGAYAKTLGGLIGVPVHSPM